MMAANCGEKKNNGKNGKVRLEIWTCPKDGDAKVVAMIIWVPFDEKDQNKVWMEGSRHSAI